MEVFMLLSDLDKICQDSAFIIRILVTVIKIVRWVIPIILILLISFDLYKVMASNPDDKTKKTAIEKVVKRLIYTLIIFLIPTIINFTFKTIDKLLSKDSSIGSTPTTWLGCWTKIYGDPNYGTTYSAGSYSTPAPGSNNYYGGSNNQGGNNYGGSNNKAHIYTCTFYTNTSGSSCGGRAKFASKEAAEQALSNDTRTTVRDTYVCGATCGDNCYEMYHCVLSQSENLQPTSTPNPTYGCCYNNNGWYTYTLTQDKNECDNTLHGFHNTESNCNLLNDTST